MAFTMSNGSAMSGATEGQKSDIWGFLKAMVGSCLGTTF